MHPITPHLGRRCDRDYPSIRYTLLHLGDRLPLSVGRSWQTQPPQEVQLQLNAVVQGLCESQTGSFCLTCIWTLFDSTQLLLLLLWLLLWRFSVQHRSCTCVKTLSEQTSGRYSAVTTPVMDASPNIPRQAVLPCSAPLRSRSDDITAGVWPFSTNCIEAFHTLQVVTAAHSNREKDLSAVVEQLKLQLQSAAKVHDEELAVLKRKIQEQQETVQQAQVDFKSCHLHVNGSNFLKTGKISVMAWAYNDGGLVEAGNTGCIDVMHCIPTSIFRSLCYGS